MDGEEELLPAGGPRLPRGVRVGALVLAGVAVLALIVVKSLSHSAPHRAATSRPQHPTPTTGPTWPTASGACGSATDLPIVSSTPPARSTGVRVMLGGDRLRVVDFDDPGTQAGLPGAQPATGRLVTELYGAGYFSTATCTGEQPRILRLGDDQRAHDITSRHPIDSVYVDGDRAWGVRHPAQWHARGYVLPLNGHHVVRLPPGFSPSAIVDGVIAGNARSTNYGPGPLQLIDASTGRIRAMLGDGLTVAAGHDVVLWTPRCYHGTGEPCTLYSRSVTTGASKRYVLPRPPSFAVGVISPDGRLAAFTLERGAQDPRFAQGHPLPPSDIAILHLDTKRLDIVPGVELPAEDPPGLAFTADGRWLVMALGAGTRTRLLAWHPGLARPYETKPIDGTVLDSPPIRVLP